ncbi:MAG: chorismate mutase [Acidimicrobiales bacterium]
MPGSVRALRGATGVAEDTTAQVTERVQELLVEMLARNGLGLDDVISVIFTSTPDLVSMFPAAAARGIGFGAVPLLCASEIPVQGAMARVIRVLLHATTERPSADLRHVYLHGAQVLRDDLPG